MIRICTKTFSSRRSKAPSRRQFHCLAQGGNIATPERPLRLALFRPLSRIPVEFVEIAQGRSANTNVSSSQYFQRLRCPCPSQALSSVWSGRLACARRVGNTVPTARWHSVAATSISARASWGGPLRPLPLPPARMPMPKTDLLISSVHSTPVI